MASDDLGVDNETGSDVVQKDKTGISGQVELGNADTANSTVIQRTLKPLCRVSVKSILGEVLEVSSERAQTLGSHRVTLVGLCRSVFAPILGLVDQVVKSTNHSTASNLVLLKRLLKLL